MRHLRTTRLALVATLALAFSFALAQGGDAEAMEVVSGITQQYVDAVNQQDAEAYSQLWSADAQALWQDQPLIEGVEAIVEDQGFAPENVGTFELSAEVTHTEMSGDMAFGQGTFENVDAEGQVLGDGKWVGIYKQEDGEWKLHRLIANTNLPLPE